MDVTYLDTNASYPISPELASSIKDLAQELFASPSSLHFSGRKSKKYINQATDLLSKWIDCEAEFIYWTSGASESNSWALHSAIDAHPNDQKVILMSAIEHDSLLQAAKYFSEKRYIQTDFIECDSSGIIRVDHVKELLEKYNSKNIALVSVQAVNNETGVIQPVEEIGALLESQQIPFHIDAAQALGKTPFSVKKSKARYVSFSGHKIGSLKGVGALTVQGKGKILSPLIHGKQQKTLRGGTENPLALASLAFILKDDPKLLFPEVLSEYHRRFEEEIIRLVPGAKIHSKGAPRVGNTSYIGFEGIDGDGALLNLDLEKIAASSGSACTSGSLDPSHVLLAMGCGKEMARSSLRFSSARFNEWTDFERVLSVLPEIIDRIRKYR